MTTEIGNSALLRTWANDGTVAVPSNAKIDEGWLRGEQPPHEWMNYIHNVLGQKVNHALSRGVADWVATTQYTAGALVNRSGDLWLCLLTNTNSEPSGVNANWTKLNSQNEFGASLVGAGYQRLPSGLILQWGTIAVTISSSAVFTYPITFPTAALWAACGNTIGQTATGIDYSAGLGALTSPSQITVYANGVGGTHIVPVFAIGH